MNIEVIIALISALSGGGLSAIILLPITRKKYQAEAMKEVQDVYQETVADLREDKRIMKEEINRLSEKQMDFEEKLNKNTVEIARLKRSECIDFNCPNRKK